MGTPGNLAKGVQHPFWAGVWENNRLAPSLAVKYEWSLAIAANFQVKETLMEQTVYCHSYYMYMHV